MSNTKWGWPLANQQTVEECELVLYALVALFHQYDTVGVPIFRKAKHNFLTKLDVVTSLDGLYTLNSKGGGPMGSHSDSNTCLLPRIREDRHRHQHLVCKRSQSEKSE